MEEPKRIFQYEAGGLIQVTANEGDILLDVARAANVPIDAPCSGEGMFRKEEAAVTDWSQETVEMCARRQAEILHSGATLVRPGGRLVYSTCTFAPEENELTIQAFLQAHPEFTLEAVEAPWFTQVGVGQFRLWPHKLKGEGHFGAVLRKAGCSEPDYTPMKEEKITLDTIVGTISNQTLYARWTD